MSEFKVGQKVKHNLSNEVMQVFKVRKNICVLKSNNSFKIGWMEIDTKICLKENLTIIKCELEK
jgi:hypothetical protein